MSARVLEFPTVRTTEEAWKRYTALVDERHEKNLWKDLEHNQRIARAWEEWSRLFLAEGGKP